MLLDFVIIYLKSITNLPFFDFLVSLDKNAIRVLLISEVKFNVKHPKIFDLTVGTEIIMCTS